MNSSIESASQNIQAPEVGSDERMQMLPRHFGLLDLNRLMHFCRTLRMCFPVIAS